MLSISQCATIGRTLTVAFALLQVCFAQQTYTISKVAGGGYITPGNGGPATDAQLYAPYGVVEDASGDIYFVEAGREIIRKVTPDGTISTVAGQYGVGGFSGDGGLAVNAKLSSPYGLAIDTAGNLYVADYHNGRIRKISTDGVITTVAGGGNPPCCGYIGDNGPATSAVITPIGVAVDPAGNLYIADVNYRVRKVNTHGIITTIAGGGHGGWGAGDGGPATQVVLGPTAIALDSQDNVYIVDHESDRIRKISTSGIISTVAGTGTNGYSGDGGPAVDAKLFVPTGIAVDNFGDLYITDTGNHVVRMVNASGIITTIAGGAPCCSSENGEPATSAWLGNGPVAITVGADRDLYFSNDGLSRVFRLTPGPLIPTTITLTADMNPQADGSTVTFKVDVEPLSGSGTPTGNVTFSVDGTSPTAVALDSTGRAIYSTNSLGIGSHAIAAAYSGTVSYAASGASLTETITAAASALSGNIVAKTGPANNRVWSIYINNSGPSAAVGTRIASVAFAQAGGPACRPVVTSAMPLAAGNLSAGTSITVPLTLDFSTCASSARFTVSIALEANAGRSNGVIRRLNQFQ